MVWPAETRGEHERFPVDRSAHNVAPSRRHGGKPVKGKGVKWPIIVAGGHTVVAVALLLVVAAMVAPDAVVACLAAGLVDPPPAP